MSRGRKPREYPATIVEWCRRVVVVRCDRCGRTLDWWEEAL